MHTWVPGTRAATLAAHGGRPGDLAETVHAATTAVANVSEGLHQWSAIIVSRHMQTLRLPGGTYLNDYLNVVTPTRTGLTRWAVFAELCDFFNVSATGAVS
jgi:hypothetical protein